LRKTNSEFLPKEVRSRAVRFRPVPLQQEIMYLVGENQLLEWRALLPKRFDEHYRLRERHVPVIVSVNQ
jgi:hypothetical protein